MGGGATSVLEAVQLWRLEVEKVRGGRHGGCNLKSEDYTYVSLGVWESKKAFKATAELPQDRKGACRFEIFWDTTSGWKKTCSFVFST